MRTGAEVAVFVTRKDDGEVLIVHRSPEQGGYWHVVAGGVEAAETVVEAAERELQEETGLVAKVTGGFDVIEYVHVLTKEPADRMSLHDPRVAEVAVTCFHVNAPDDWEPKLDWEHDRHRWCDPEEAFDSLRWPRYRSRSPQALGRQAWLTLSLCEQRRLASVQECPLPPKLAE